MNSPPRKKRPPAVQTGGRDHHSSQHTSDPERNEARGEFQGMGSGRRASQPGPVWPRPRESAAADALERAWPDPIFRVVSRKATGRRATLITTGNRAEAEEWVSKHRGFAANCGAELTIETTS